MLYIVGGFNSNIAELPALEYFNSTRVIKKVKFFLSIPKVFDIIVTVVFGFQSEPSGAYQPFTGNDIDIASAADLFFRHSAADLASPGILSSALNVSNRGALTTGSLADCIPAGLLDDDDLTIARYIANLSRPENFA